MNDLEKKREELFKKLEAGDSLSVKDEKKGRESAAKQWVSHFFAISKLVKELKEDGVMVSSEDELVNELVKSWDEKRNEKDSAIADLFL